MLEDPQQLGPGDATGQTGDGRVDRRFRQARPQQFTPEQPQANQRADRDHRAETRNLEPADTEEDWIHGVRLIAHAIVRGKCASQIESSHVFRLTIIGT